MLLDLQNRGKSLSTTITENNQYDADDEYVHDERNDLRPSEVVQSKLVGMLTRGMSIPVSCMHNCRHVRR